MTLRPFDELGWLGRHSVQITFDTRQNVDESYDGQDWKYYR